MKTILFSIVLVVFASNYSLSAQNNTDIPDSWKTTDYYWKKMTTFYDDPLSRNNFFNHLNLDLSIQFTSGKKATGRGQM